MILVDANVLLYAVDSDSPHHRKARAWLEDALSGARTLGFPWVSVLAFLRLTTRSEVFVEPLTPNQAVGYVDSWLEQPCARLVGPAEGHWGVLRALLLSSGTAGNLTSDAHLAALALERGWAVCSTDNDFRRFPGIEHVNPLA